MLIKSDSTFGNLLVSSESTWWARQSNQVDANRPRRIFNVPCGPSMPVGREELLTHLETHSGDSDPNPTSCDTLRVGCVGKTQIAVTYAFRHGSEFPVIWWLAASDPTVLAESFRALARELEMPEADSEDIADTIAAVKNWLAQSPEPWLLCSTTPRVRKAFAQYLPDLGNGQILVTSRSPLFGNLGAQLQLQSLTDEQGAEYLRRRTGSRGDCGCGRAGSGAGRPPFALVQAGAFADAKKISLRRYLQIYEEHQLLLLEEGRPESDYPHSEQRPGKSRFATSK